MDLAKKILVVDDDPDIRLFCSTVLGASGYDVSCAGSGAEGLGMAEALQPALILLDIMMEDVDTGFQVAEKFKAMLPDVKIIVLSSIAEASYRVFDTASLPVKEMVNKPIEPALLVKKVKRLLG